MALQLFLTFNPETPVKHLFNGSGFHLTPPVIDDFRTTLFGKIQDVFRKQPSFNEPFGLQRPLMPADEPMNRFPGIFVQKEIQIKKQPFFEGRQIADVPTPSLVGTGQFLSNRWKGIAVMMPVLSSQGGEPLGTY